MEKERYSNLDFGRIICMMMIVSLHYFGEGGLLYANNALKINKLIAGVVVVACRGAVNYFYLNSGFFISEEPKEISFYDSWKPAIKLYKQVWTYSTLVFVVAVLTGVCKFSIVALLRAVFPLMGNQYWFATVFILIVCLRPYLNKWLPSLESKELRVLCLILLSYDSIQAALGINVLNEFGNGLLHALTMVILGYTLRRNKQYLCNQYVCVLIYFICVIALGGAGIMLQRYPSFPLDYWKNLMVYNSPFVVLMGYALFGFFANLKREIKLVSQISGSVFSIYLIQDHTCLREKFWEIVIKCKEFYSSTFMIVHYIIAIFFITAVCVITDTLFKQLIKKFCGILHSIL